MSVKILNSVRKGALALSLIGLLSACGSPEDRAQSHYERAQSLFQEGSYAKAVLEYRNALQFKEDFAPAWYGLSRVETHNQNWDGAASMLRRVIELDPNHVDARIELGRLIMLSGDYDKALELANAAIEIKNDRADAFVLRAALLLKLNDKDGAISDAERALAINPNNIDALAVLAFERFQANDRKGALLFVDRGLAVDKKNLTLLLFKFKVAEAAADVAGVEAIAKQLVEFYPADKNFRHGLATFYVRLGRQADAEKLLRETAQRSPDDFEANLDVVRFVVESKGPAAGKTELERLVRASKNSFPYRMALVDLYINTNDRPNAEALLMGLISDTSVETEDTLRAKAMLAELRLSMDQTKSAQDLIAEALSVDERNSNALGVRAAINLKLGNIDEAIADLRTALNDQPNSVALLMRLATALDRKGAIDLADDRLFEATKASGFSPAIALQYSKFLFRRGAEGRAAKILKEADARSPGRPEILSVLANIALSNHDWERAQSIAEQIRATGAKPRLADQIFAAVSSGQRKPDESINILQQAYSAAPDDHQVMASLVKKYIDAKKLDEAEDFLRSVLKAHPDNSDAFVLLGTIKLLKRKLAEAESYFKDALVKQPDNANATTALVNFYVGQSDLSKARESLKQGLAKSPKSFTLRLIEATLTEQAGDYDKAIQLYESLLEEFPDALIAVNNLASLLIDHRNDEANMKRAYSLAQRLKDIQIPQFRDTLGWTSYKNGDYRTAVFNLEKAAEGLPNIPIVHYRLGLSYAAAGQKDRAKQSLSKAVELALKDPVLQEQAVKAMKDLEKSGG